MLRKFVHCLKKCINAISSFSDMKGVFALNRTCTQLNASLSNCSSKVDKPYNDIGDTKSEINSDTIDSTMDNSIFSELKYEFPNRFQYNHYILLETDSNIFQMFENIKLLHLVIGSQQGSNDSLNPSNAYLSDSQYKDKTGKTQLERYKKQSTLTDQYGDYIIMDDQNMIRRPPTTKVETNIYSRAIFNYFETNFKQIDTLMITFDPCTFVSTFITYNIPKILSKISHLYLLQSGNSTNLTQLKEGCSILQYCTNLKSLTVNFPFSKEYYPIINNISKNGKLANIFRIEQPCDLAVESSAIFNNEQKLKHLLDLTKIKAMQMSINSLKNGEKQNIVRINQYDTTLTSNVKLQKNLIDYYSPSMTSLHLHGSKGFYSMWDENKNDDLINYSVKNSSNNSSSKNGNNNNVIMNKSRKNNKVFFGLTEFCVTVSDYTYSWIVNYLNVVPQLTRLQLIVSGKSQIRDLIAILNHFNYNQNLQLNYDSNTDSIWQYYYNYYIYYGYNLCNSAKKLRHLTIITKHTTNLQNYALMSMCEEWFNYDNRNLTLLHIKLIIKYSFWHFRDLSDILSIIHSSPVFKKDNMSFQIVMPMIPASKSSEYQTHYDKSLKMSQLLRKYSKENDQDLKYHNMQDNDKIESDLKQLESQINENGICTMRSEKLDAFVSVIIIEKVRHSPNQAKKDEQEMVMTVKSDFEWVNHCYYCDLAK